MVRGAGRVWGVGDGEDKRSRVILLLLMTTKMMIMTISNASDAVGCRLGNVVSPRCCGLCGDQAVAACIVYADGPVNGLRMHTHLHQRDSPCSTGTSMHISA